MSALQALADGVVDLTELEVLTFQGDITAIVDDKNAIKWAELLQTAKAQGQVKLMAATQIKIDGDTILFTAPDIAENLRAAHLDAVKAAQEYRQGLITAFADLLNIKPK